MEGRSSYGLNLPISRSISREEADIQALTYQVSARIFRLKVTRVLMRKILFIILLFLFCASIHAAESIIFSDGKSLIAQKHESKGESIVLIMEGGSAITFDRSRVKEIREINLENVIAEVTIAETAQQNDIDCNKIIEEIAVKHSIDSTLVKAIIKVESNYNAKAISPKGAQGLMQLMPKTAVRFNVNDVFDPEENIEGGIKYLKFLTERYGNRFDLILAAYNAGEEAVERYGGIPPYRETINYILKVLRLYNKS